MAAKAGPTHSPVALTHIDNYIKVVLSSDASAKSAGEAVLAKIYTLLAHSPQWTQTEVHGILSTSPQNLCTALLKMKSIEQVAPGAFAPDLSFLIKANHVVINGTSEQRQDLLRELGDTETNLRMRRLFGRIPVSTPAIGAPTGSEAIEKKEGKKATRSESCGLDAPLDADRTIFEQDDLPGSARPLPPPTPRADDSSYLRKFWNALPGIWT